MALAASAEVSVIIAWCLTGPQVRQAWPVLLYWAFGGMFVAGFVVYLAAHGDLSRRSALRRLEAAPIAQSAPASAGLPGTPVEAGSGRMAIPGSKPQDPVRFAIATETHGDKQLVISMTNAGTPGRFYAECSFIQDTASSGFAPGLEGARSPWRIPWVDGASDQPRFLNRGDSARLGYAQLWPTTTRQGTVRTAGRFRSTGDDVPFILKEFERLGMRVRINRAGSDDYLELIFVIGVDPNCKPVFQTAQRIPG